MVVLLEDGQNDHAVTADVGLPMLFASYRSHHLAEGDSMIELELTRTRGDRSLYALDGVGTIRLEGFFSRSATAEAGGSRWRLSRRGLWQRTRQATDMAGSVVGEFVPRDVRRGGTLDWAGRKLTLRPASSWRERYALVDGERELALLDGKGWGRRPVSLTVLDPEPIEPGLLLFAAFVVRGLAADAGSAAAAGVSASSGAAAG